MTLFPACTQTRRVVAWSICVTGLIAVAFAYQRSGIANPFELPVYRHLILFQDYYAILPFIVVLSLALVPPVRALGDRLASWCGRHVWIVAGAATVGFAIGTHAVYHVHPLSLDEYAVLFQSEIFTQGRLSGHYPPQMMDWLIPKYFQGRFLRISMDTGAVAAVYWPGFSLLLVPFTALGAAWLLNPLIGGATLLVMHRIALKLFGNAESAGYVVLLTLASPAVTINALSFYAMPAHLLASALFMLLLLNPSPARALAAGLVGSIALVLHNPVPHLLFALPWIAWLAFQPGRARLLGALAAGYAPVCILLGWGWAIYLQSIGTHASASALATPGGAAQTLLFRLRTVFGWTGMETHLLDLAKLWLWAVPALLVVAGMGAWQQRRDRGVWLVLACCALLTYFGFFIVRFDQGHGWGFRYFHSAWLVLPLFAVSALQPWLQPPAPSRRPSTAATGLPGYLAACALLSLVLLTTFRALQVEHFIARHLAQKPATAPGEPRVVFLDVSKGYYAWDLIQNDPFLRNPVKVLGSRGAQNDAALIAGHFPGMTLLSSDQRGSVWGVAPR